MPEKKKQAVLLIHGIGDQHPMDTLRGFVRTVWTTDASVHHEHAIPGVFSKPDDVSQSFELRRLTTTKAKDDIRTDFYEFYWAHLMEGTSLAHVIAWSRRLVVRWPWSLPPNLRPVWFLLVCVGLSVAFFSILTALPESYQIAVMPKWMSAALGLLSAWFAIPILKNFVGDAARYLHPAPANIGRRQEIRANAVEVLDKLHNSNQYDRIIVVGHSLGTVIGLDMLTYAWPKYVGEAESKGAHPLLDALEDEVAAGNVTVEHYQAQQRALLHELQGNGCGWLVSDFVTMGSPLTHADILLATNLQDLLSKQAEREILRCPPTLEKGRFSYPPDRVQRSLHHAAVFGPTRWSNLFFPCKAVVKGDLIGGPLQAKFGKGIRDCPVQTDQRGGLFSHTLYWTSDGSTRRQSHIEALRNVLRIVDQ